MPNDRLKIVFFGTPQFAVPFLDGLIKNYKVIAVITQPDRPSGRKQVMTPPPVKVLAEENNIKVLQPETIKNNSDIKEELTKLNPDLSVVVAYGKMIPDDILNIPKFKTINVHPSLLPKYRGASPVQSAILNGDNKTGVSIMLLDSEMDHGPILTQREVVLNGSETNESLHTSLAKLGTSFLVETISKYTNNKLSPCEQDHDKAVYCREIQKNEAKINWMEPANIIERKIRAFYPWPIAWTTLNNKRLKIFPPVKIIDKTLNQPGQLKVENDKLIISCGQKSISPNEIQLEGKKISSVKNFLAGQKDIDDEVLE